MHRAGLVLAALLLAGLPPAAADQRQDASAGLNLGFVAPGIWDIFSFSTSGGPATLSLNWVKATVFPFADYDLRLYRPDAMSNDQLADNEMMAHSSQHPYAHHSERIDIHLAPGTYWIAVVPFQAQGEKYTLDAEPGQLDFYASAFGHVAFEP